MGAGAVSDPAAGESGSIPVTINKLRAMNALSGFSSQQPGHDAAYAIDNSNGTWWEPAASDAQPTLTIELSPATRFDAVQLFTIDSLRLMFTGGRGFGGSGRRGGVGAGAPVAEPVASPAATGSSAVAPAAANLPATARINTRLKARWMGRPTRRSWTRQERRLAKYAF